MLVLMLVLVLVLELVLVHESFVVGEAAGTVVNIARLSTRPAR